MRTKSFLHSLSDEYLDIDAESQKDLGLDLAARYASGDPFPHIVIDDFLPGNIVDLCLQNFPVNRDPESRTFNRAQERLKTSFQPDYMPPQLRALFYAFNAKPFIRIVENITGIQQLIPDPYFVGGGFHEISNGGHLSIHADFNHHKLLNLERRVNVLIYLNPDWSDDYGGQLEFWRKDMSECVHSIVPVCNRCAIFTTTDESMHGNPRPVAHPGGQTRKSIALYYYTATWDDTKASRTTQFRSRPGTSDRHDWKVRATQTARDLLPPVAYRYLKKRKSA